MTYLMILFGWVMLWFIPRPRTLNAFGLVLALWLLVTSAFASALVPATFLQSMIWWTIYMAVYLVVGAGIMLWRYDKVAPAKDDSLLLPKGRLEPVMRNTLHKVLNTLCRSGLLAALLCS